MRWVLFLGFAVCLGGCGIHPPKPFADEVPVSPAIAKLEQAQKSRVLFLNASQPQAPAPGTPLRSGEVVMTDSKGIAQIRFNNQAISRLAPQSRVTLRSGQSLKLEEGSLMLTSPGFLQIETWFGRINIQNGGIYVRSSPQSARILVLRGRPQSFILESDVKVVLSPGEEMMITPWGIPLKVKKLNQRQKNEWLKRIKREFKLTDRLFPNIVFLEEWQKPPTKPKVKASPQPLPYQPPLYNDPPVYEYEEPYYPPEPFSQPVVRHSPPVVYEPPPLAPEPEIIPLEAPLAAESSPSEPIPSEPPNDENPE